MELTSSILSQARKQDEKLCEELCKGSPQLGHRVSFDAATTHRAAARIRELNQALMEASHDRDRFMADAERGKS